MGERNRATDKQDQGIGEVDNAPREMNNGEGNWNLKGVKAGVAASRFDQTSNRGAVDKSAGSTSVISKQAKG